MKILQLSDIHWSKTSSMLDEHKNLRDDMEEYLETYRKNKEQAFLLLGKLRKYTDELCRLARVWIIAKNLEKVL